MALANKIPYTLTATIIALVVTSSVCSASDLTDNEIADGQAYGSLSRRASSRYVVMDCKSCGPSECQVMGMQRYAEPRCEALSGLGAPCRPYQEPDNKTLHFPSTIMYCNNVYMQSCPCASGLVCDPELAECKSAPEVDSGTLLDSTRFDTDSTASSDEYDPIPVAFEPMPQEEHQHQQRPGSGGKFPWAVARFH